MMEALIGLLRNAENCNSKDVEVIYLSFIIFSFIFKNKKDYCSKWRKPTQRESLTMLLISILQQSRVYRKVSLIYQILITVFAQIMLPSLLGLLNILCYVKILSYNKNAKLHYKLWRETKKARNSEEIIIKLS